MYKASIEITLRPSILDPQGKATQRALGNLGFESVERVRMGKFVEMWIHAESSEEAEEVAREACRKLLANSVMEDFAVSVEQVVMTSAA
jgi:phosphoribosylformylglycinamidine synthase subunit PurS